MPDKTVVFTDLVDFSDLQNHPHFGGTVQERNRRFWDEVLAPHNARIRERATKFSGSEQGTWGDSFFLVFNSAIEAVQFASDLLRSFQDIPIPTAPGKRAQLHIGIHSGNVESFDGSYTGAAISTAARIISLAGTDHILFSDTTRQLCGEIGGMRFLQRGDFLLKGPGLINVWEADWDGRGPRALKKPSLSSDLELPPLMSIFVGRTNELAELDSLLDANKSLFLGGLSGIGKTSTLVQLTLRRFHNERLADNAFFYFDCSSRDMRSEEAGALLLAQLGRFLAQVGADAAAVAAACSESRSEGDRLTAVGHALVSIPCLLLLDNFQDSLNEQRNLASASLGRVLGFLLSRDLGPSRLVFASFEDWRTPDRVAVHSHTLRDLQLADARLLLAKLEIHNDALTESALAIVGGHPQALQWFSRLAREDHIAMGEVIDALAAIPRDQFTERQFHYRLANELLNRIWKRLSEPSHALLLAGAVFREPPLFAAMRAAAALDEVPAREARQELLSYYLTQATGLSAPHLFHPLVREYGATKGRESSELLNMIHRRAALWWRERAGEPPEAMAGIEAHHHFLQAGAAEEANELAGKLLTVLEMAGETAWAAGLLKENCFFDEWRVKQEPDNADAHRYFANALARLNDPRAEVHFQRGLALMPKFPKLLTGYAGFLAKRGRDKEAEYQFRIGIEAVPDHAPLRNEYARFLSRRGKTAEADEQFRAGIEADPKMPHLRVEYARFLKRMGKTSEADAQFRAGVEANPNDAVARNEYARFLSRLDKISEADAQFRAGVAADAKMPHLRTEYARFLDRQGKAIEAEAQFQAGIEANPKEAVLRNEYARFLAWLGKTVQADAQFRAGIEADPRHVPVRNEYARFLDRLGKTAEAEAQFRAGIEIHPNDVVLRDAYARFLIRLKKYPEACEQICAGFAVDSDNSYLHRTEETLWRNHGYSCICADKQAHATTGKSGA